MSQSPNGVSITQSTDSPIVDSNGVTWHISPSRQVIADGALDADGSEIIMLAFVNGMIWRQTDDLMWSNKRHAGDQWWPPGRTHHSPLSGAAAQEVAQIETGVAEVLAEIAAFKQDFDAFRALPANGAGSISSLTPILSALTALQLDMDSRENAVSALITKNQAVLLSGFTALLADISAMFNLAAQVSAANQASQIGLLNQILATITGQAQPDHVVLETAHATRKPQTIPSVKGP